MNASIIKLAIASVLPVVAAVVLYLFDKKTRFGQLNEKLKNLVFGIIFGGLAIVGTEWGIPINGAQVNCRDAAVMVAGLLFSGPAGIIAGIIGGVERWIAVSWGVGSFTRLACSMSTIIAGFYSAALRKYMFEDKKPGWLISFATGVVMEVLHLTMVFLTNMTTPTEAMNVVKACTAPMVVANGVSLMLSSLALAIISGELSFVKKNNVRISQTIQRWLLVTVLLAFAATSYFVYSLQDTIASTQTESLLNLAISETSADILDASNENLLALTHTVASEIDGQNLSSIAQRYDVAEISIIDSSGHITDSTEEKFIGFDMASGAQSAAFLCLLGNTTTTEFVQNYGPISYDASVMRKYAAVKYGKGFVQVGYDSENFQKDLAKRVIGITSNRHVGNTGFIMILDKEQLIVSYPKTVSFYLLQTDLARLKLPGPDTIFLARFNGSLCCCKYSMSEGYYILSVLPQSEALQMRNIALYVNTFLEIMVFAVLFGLIYILIKRVVVNQIRDINTSLGKITRGNLDEVVDVRSNEEFSSLSDDINSTVSTLKRYIAEASARIDAELEFAKNIQASALPNVFPAFPKRRDFDIFASMNPAKEVGGDFYDFYLTGTDTLNFLIADVSGKGIPAAMFMMRAKTELKSLTEAELPLNEVFTHGNTALCEGNDAGMFVTAWQGNIDLISGLVQFANAGHNPPLVKRKGKFEYLRSRAGFVLAGMEGVKYKTQEIQLEPGDEVFLYTDGVTEATNASNELYGEERLLAIINAMDYPSVKELCLAIKADVDSFVGDAPQFDDITMVAFRYIGTPPAPKIHFDEAQIKDIPTITEFVESELEKIECPMKTVIQINIAIDELCSNIIKYGYPTKPGPVTVQVIEKKEPHVVYIRFEDEGIPYNPLTAATPDITQSAEERSIGGLGIYMVRKSMDEVKYKYEDNKNILTIMKRL